MLPPLELKIGEYVIQPVYFGKQRVMCQPAMYKLFHHFCSLLVDIVY